MPRLNQKALLEKLKQRPPSTAVFLHGDDEFLRESAVREVLNLLLDPATRDFNFDQLRGAEVTPETLGSLLATPPMMAEHRLVLVREAQGLAVRAREVVEAWTERPAPGVILILTATIPGGSKAKFYDNLRSRALTVEFPAVDPDELPVWIVEHAAERFEVKVEVDAARALGMAIGPQLGILAAELEKISAYVGDRRVVTIDDIRAVGGYIPRVDRWRWFDRIGERDWRTALHELAELLDSGETGVGLALGMGSHLLRLGILVHGGRDALDRHLPPNQRWLANRLQTQARRWTPRQIDAALTELLRTDRLLKSASLTDRQAMEELLLRLAAPEGSSGFGASLGGSPLAASAR